MSAATILFIDMVGYSKKSTVDQHKLISLFNTKFKPRMKPLLGAKPSQALCLPTGDGAAFIFIHVEKGRQWKIESIMDLIFELQEWAQSKSVALRIGVHVGSVEIVTDLNGHKNVCGTAINMAQRVMDAARDRQVLFSMQAVQEYVGHDINRWKLSAKRHQIFRIGGPFEIQVKHGLMLTVYRLLPDGLRKHGWCADDPEIKFWLSVSPTRLPKSLADGFAKRLSKARDVALIQLTGKRLLKALETGKFQFSPTLRRFWILMPSKRFFVNDSGRPDSRIGPYKRVIRKWSAYCRELRKTHPEAQIEVRIFDAPPYFGASFLDWREPGGRAHVSPYIWGVDVKQCPGYDISWAGTKVLPLYRSYVDGLEELYKTSRKVG